MGWLLSCHWLLSIALCQVPSGRIENETILDPVMEMTMSLLGRDESKETKDTNFVFVIDNYFTLLKFVGKTGLQGVQI